MTKMLKLIQALKISNEIYLPVGTIMDESTWCDFIGRKGGIDVTNSSDSEWWEEILHLFSNVSYCNCPLESTDVYDSDGNYLGYVCLGCGYFNK